MKSNKAYTLVLLLLLACNAPKEPSNPLLDTDTMARFLTELHFHESMVNNKYIDSDYAHTHYRELFEKYQVTPLQFDSAMSWYEHHYKEYMNMYAKVRSNFEKEIKKINSGIYDYYLPKLPSIWTYYGVVPAADTLCNTLEDLSYYLQLPATELRTNHRGGHPYVERLGGYTPYWKVRD